MRPSIETPVAAARVPWLTQALPLLVLLVGLLATAAVAWLVQRQHMLEVRSEFERLATRVADLTLARLAAPELALRGAQAALALHRGEPDLQGLSQHVQTLARAGDYPGITAIAFARAQQPTQGDAPSFIVEAIEPAPPGLPALGDDLAADPAFAPGLALALAQGRAALTIANQGGKPTLGLLLPLLRPGVALDGELQRRRATVGALLATLDLPRALAPVVASVDGLLDFELYDGESAARPKLLYDGMPAEAGAAAAGSSRLQAAGLIDLRTVQIASRTLTLRIAPTPLFEARHRAQGRMLALASGGALLALLAALLVRVLAHSGERAQALARSMTADLERLAEVVRHTTHAVVIIDAERRIAWVNPAFEVIAARPLARLAGLRLRELGLLAHNDRAVIDELVRAQDEGRAHQCELRLRVPGGGERWMHIDLQPRRAADGTAIGFLVLGTDISAQREAMQALALQQAHLKAVIAGANCGVALWHVPRDEITVDERMAQLLGHTAAELNPSNAAGWRARMHATDAPITDALMRELVRGQRSDIDLDLRMRHRDGRWIWLQARASVIERDAKGRTVWLSAIYMDVTERKRAEQRWQVRGELSSDWFWQTDAEHRVVEVDGGLAQGVLAVPDEYRSRRRDQIPWFEPPAMGWIAYHAMLDRHEAFKGVIYRSRSAGRERWIEIDGQPLFDDEGRFTGYAGVGREISERLRVTEQLRESLALLDALLASLAIPVVMKDRQGRLQRVNPAYALSVGSSVEALIGKTVDEILDPDAARRHAAEDEAIMASGQPRHYELRQRLPDGREADWLIYKSPVIGPDGQVQGIVGTSVDITERREVERTLERERARLADMIAGADAAVGEWDLASGRMILDDRFTAMLGLAGTEALPTTVQQWQELLHAEDDAALREAIRRHLTGAADHLAVDLRLRHANGNWVWAHVRGRITARDAAGRATRVMGAFFDVTERRIAAERWRARAELSGDWFWQTDVSHRFLAMVTGNRSVALTRGADIIGRRRDEMEWIEPPEMGWTAFHAMLDRHEPFRGIVYRNNTFPGDARWIEIDGRPRFDDVGRFEGYDGVGRDITERRRVTEQLRESLAQLDSLIRAVPIPLVMKDREGRNSRVNRAYCEFYGVTEAQVIGCTVFDFWTPEVAARYHAEDLALMADRRTRRSAVQVTTSTGQKLDIMVHKSPIVAPDGEVIGTVGAVVDMSEQHAAARALVEAKEAAESANRAKSAFLATMSHEIRTPMNGVIGMAELLAHTDLGDDQARQVQTIVDSARSLLGILDDILDFSKIEAGRLELETAGVELAPLVESACDALAPLALAGDVAVHLHVDSRLPRTVIADPTRLRQIVTNLLGNAIKFSARSDGAAQHASAGPGFVRVRLLRHGDEVQLEVADNGIGMDEPTMARLFVPFSQGEISTTRRFGGTGLGLAITHRLVEIMGGHIGVDSRPGAGSQFSVRLPLASSSDAAPETAAEAVLAGLRCCIVEDELIDAADLADWLRDAGAEVTRVGPAEALAGDAQVVVRLQPGAAADAADSGAADSMAPAELLVGRGRRAEARLLGGARAVIDQPRRATLVRAVALVSGRVVPGQQPLAAADARAMVAADGGAQQLILVAEDDPTNRLVIERQLELLGYRAELAHDGAEALRRWRADRPRYAALLTDLHMPGMDGYTLAQTIRRAESAGGAPLGGDLQRMPILALTANALKGEALRARAAGIDDYLTKPVPLQLLRSTLQQWLPQVLVADAQASAADPQAAAPVWDAAIPRGLIGPEPEALAELLQDFLHMAATHAAQIRGALAASDGGSAAATAHRLKSAARAAGALALAAACEVVEGCRARPDAAACARALKQFDAAFDAAQHTLVEALECPQPASGTTRAPTAA